MNNRFRDKAEEDFIMALPPKMRKDLRFALTVYQGLRLLTYAFFILCAYVALGSPGLTLFGE